MNSSRGSADHWQVIDNSFGKRYLPLTQINGNICRHSRPQADENKIFNARDRVIGQTAFEAANAEAQAH